MTEAPPLRERSSERWERRGFLKPCRMYEALTLPFAFPPCGRDVNKAY